MAWDPQDFEAPLSVEPPLVIEGLCLTTGLAVLNWIDIVIHIYFLCYFVLRVSPTGFDLTYISFYLR